MLEIRLLGAFEAHIDGQPLTPVRSRKEHWLLALLVLCSNRPVEREWLETTFWPEQEKEKAQDYLRHTLSALRKALGVEERRLQSPSPHSLQLDLTDADIDVIAFDTAIKIGDATSLESALLFYRGALLEG